MLKKCELYFSDLIRGKQKGLFATLLKLLLLPLSWIFRFVVFCRNWAYDQGWMRKQYPPIPLVISIGNIVVGGTGKTPVVALLAKEFYETFALAIIARGYRAEAEKEKEPVVVSEGEGPLYPASYCGDEAFLLSKQFPKATVIVGKNRHDAALLAAKAGVQILLLDDAMQHRSLARDIEVVVLNAKDPFGQGYFLPRGFLRESIRSLSRADVVLINHVYDHALFAELKRKIGRYTEAPVIGMKLEVVAVWDFTCAKIPSIAGKKVALFSGIANPEYFRHTVCTLGAEVMDHKIVADHEEVRVDRLRLFAHHAFKNGADLILCTEKDIVKLDNKLIDELRIGWVQVAARLVEGELEWRLLMNKTKETLEENLIV